MQKKNLAIVLASLFALPAAAQAEVTIYGFISAGVESAKATGNGNAAQEYKRTTRVVDENSRIGFKGSEDLGNGLKAIWQLEQSLRQFEQGGVNDKGDSAVFATRNSFVGLSDATFGTLVLGLYDSAYKRLTDTGQDLMVNTTAGTQGASNIFSRGEDRYKNSVSYTSQSWNGLIAGASYAADENGATNKNRWSVAGQYTLEGLKVGLGYDRQENPSKFGITATLNKIDYTKLSASYKIADTLLVAGYEWGRGDRAAGDDLKQDGWTVGVQQNIGNGSVRLSYNALGKLDGATNADDYKAKQWVLGGTYNLSKMTQAFAYATKIDNKKAQNVNFTVNPVYTSGQGTSAAVLAAGNDLQAIGAGLRVNF